MKNTIKEMNAKNIKMRRLTSVNRKTKTNKMQQTNMQYEQRMTNKNEF